MMIITITGLVQTVVDLAKEKFSAHSGIAHRLSRARQSELKHQVLGIKPLHVHM